MSSGDGNLNLKGLGTILLGLLILALVWNVFFPSFSGTMGSGYAGGMHEGMMNGGGYGAFGGGFTITGLLGGLLLLIIKLLSILLVVGLVIGIFLVLKEYFFGAGGNTESFLKNMGLSQNKVNCPNCGKSVNPTWQYCPECGKPIQRQNISTGESVSNES